MLNLACFKKAEMCGTLSRLKSFSKTECCEKTTQAEFSYVRKCSLKTELNVGKNSLGWNLAQCGIVYSKQEFKLSEISKLYKNKITAGNNVYI